MHAMKQRRMISIVGSMMVPVSLPLWGGADGPEWQEAAVAALETELVAEYGTDQRDRLVRGMHQVAEFWRAEDGDRTAFEDFVRAQFAGRTRSSAGRNPEGARGTE